MYIRHKNTFFPSHRQTYWIILTSKEFYWSIEVILLQDARYTIYKHHSKH